MRNEKDRERRAQWLLQKKRSWDKDGEVKDLAVLKQIKRPTESDEKNNYLSIKSFARLKNVLKFSILVYNLHAWSGKILASRLSH